MAKIKLAVILLVSMLIATSVLFIRYGAGRLLAREIKVTIKSAVPRSEGRRTFYILGIVDGAGKSLVSAERLTAEATHLEGGKLVNDGHGIWANLPKQQDTFSLEWQGWLAVERGAPIFLKTGKSPHGSVLDINLGHRKMSIEPASFGEGEPLLLPLGKVYDYPVVLLIGRWFVLSTLLAALIMLLNYLYCKAKNNTSVRKLRIHGVLTFYKGKLVGTFLDATVLGVAIIIFLPFLVLALNIRSVDFTAVDLLLGSALPFLGFVMVATLVAIVPVFNRGMRFCYRAALMIIIFLALFPNRTGEMTGITDFYSSLHNLCPFLKLSFAAVMCGILARYRPSDFRWLYRISAVAVIAASGFLVMYSYSRSYAEKGDNSITDKSYFTELGREKNVIILVLDAFTGKFAEKIFAENPELRHSFRGFTLYPNAIAPALNTPAGLSTMLTGGLEIAINEQSAALRNERMINESFLRGGLPKGIKSAYLSVVRPLDSDVPVFNEQMFFVAVNISIADKINNYRGFFVTCLSRILPLGGVQFMYRTDRHYRRIDYGKTILDTYKELPTPMQRAPLASHMALTYFTDNLHIGECDEKIIFLHSKLTHYPFSFTEDGTYSANINPKGTGVYGLKAALRIMEKLEQLDLLDKTLFMVVSDHGGLSDKPTYFTEFNPLVMIRAPQAEPDELLYNNTTVWLGDVAATVCDFMDLKKTVTIDRRAQSLLKTPPDLNRTLDIPLFVRPDQESHHAPLNRWARLDISGSFSNYVAQVNFSPQYLLRKNGKITVKCGVDVATTKSVEAGWLVGTGVQYHVELSLDDISLVKLKGPGLVAISKRDGEYLCKTEVDFEAQSALLEELCGRDDVIIAGLDIDSSLLRNVFFADIRKEAEKNFSKINLIYIKGSSAKNGPLFHCSNNDLSVEIDWKPN